MPKFGKKSKSLLEQVHPDLQLVLNTAIDIIDFTILDSTIRTLEQQKQFVKEGKSKTLNSKHLKKFVAKYNKEYSFAVDCCPYPIDWNDRERFCLMAGIILGVAKVLKDEGLIKSNIVWGGDWNKNGITKDEKFSDCPHFEIKD